MKLALLFGVVAVSPLLLFGQQTSPAPVVAPEVTSAVGGIGGVAGFGSFGLLVYFFNRWNADRKENNDRLDKIVNRIFDKDEIREKEMKELIAEMRKDGDRRHDQHVKLTREVVETQTKVVKAMQDTERGIEKMEHTLEMVAAGLQTLDRRVEKLENGLGKKEGG